VIRVVVRNVSLKLYYYNSLENKVLQNRMNLDAYKEKLEKAIKSYERRLNLVIWRALSQEERDKFKEDGPVQYIEHKEALLEALENLGWPVSYEDVKLLEDEILTAIKYVEQASDLQEAIKKEIQKKQQKHVHVSFVECNFAVVLEQTSVYSQT
uniref:Uncharacterized protein n=1 Tax=Malurus cyaneus samueli TaxID=2593467 RepID=A0A8C5UG80_9PASS